MKLKEQLAAARKDAGDYIARLKADGHEVTEDELAEARKKSDLVNDLTAKVQRQDDLKAFDGLGSVEEEPKETRSAKSLGEHFVKSIGSRSMKEPGTLTVPEFKAAGDTQAVGGANGGYGPLITDVDRSFVLPKRERLVVEDLVGAGNVSGNAITYPVFGALEGGTGTVAEGGQKPQMHVAAPVWRTDRLGEVAGFFKLTDDMAEDLDYVVSEINSTALYDLALKTEAQILSGDGTGSNLLGIRSRSGVQTHAQGEDSAADALFKAIQKVQTATGFSADALVIHPLDYQELRLAKDGNEQYFGGGYFTGPYGNGGVLENPPVWGLRTVVTVAAPQGEPLVGAFQAASKVFRKGGVKVESTNSHVDDFTNDKITVRVKARLGLQVKYPAAFVKVTLAPVVAGS